jgi:putative ABC transport system permease protein
MQQRLDTIYKHYAEPYFKPFGLGVMFSLQPLTEVYLFSLDYNEPLSNNKLNVGYIYIFIAIALFMLTVASINYMNLAIARSTKRAKEVGIRKTLGSYPARIFWQFLIESLLLCLVAFLFSLVILDLSKPYFDELFGKTIALNFWQEPLLLGFFLLLVILTGLTGGWYPAIYLSRFQPAEVLKSKQATGPSSKLRKTLLIVQFAIAIIMLTGTTIVYLQLNFITNKDLGLNKDLVVRIKCFNQESKEKLPELKEALRQNPSIKSIASASGSPVIAFNRMAIKARPQDSLGLIELLSHSVRIDHNYLQTLGLELIEGENFSEDSTLNKNKLIINETFVKKMNWQEPIGQEVIFYTNDSTSYICKVIGVVKDFHNLSLRDKIEPMMLEYGRYNNSFLFIQLNSREVTKSLDFIKNAWEKVIQTQPFEYHFLAEDFNENFKKDEQKARLLAIFSLLIILVTSLGLFGLSSYTTQQRNKELNIRKILGASPQQLFSMVIREYLQLVLLAIIIAWPVAFAVMYFWLQQFAYHIEVPLWPFLTAALFALTVTLLTVGIHALKAARSNPAVAIKENA